MIRTTIAVIMSLSMLFGQFAGIVNGMLSSLASDNTKINKISVASDVSKILYGEPSLEYKGKTFAVSDDGITVTVSKSERRTDEVNPTADNFNAVGNKLYYSVFDKGKSYVRCMNIDSGEYTTLLECTVGEIVNMYVVNEDTILYSIGNSIYRCKIDTFENEILTSHDDMTCFAPTSAGIIYYCGNVSENELYLDEICLIRNIDYFDFEDNYLTFAIQGIPYQITIEKLYKFALSVRSNKNESKYFLSIVEPFDLYGEYSIAELFDSEESCSYCDSHDDEEVPENGEQNDSIESLYRLVEDENTENFIMSLNNRQQQIIDKANAVVDLTWNCQVNFYKYYSQNPSNSSRINFDYEANTSYTGLPYSRPGRFEGSEYEDNHVYVGYDSFPNSNTASTPSGFVTQIQNSNDLFWQAASDTDCAFFGPLYGQDCSRFVTYSWNVNGHWTGGYATDASCYRVREFSQGNATLEDLSVLLPGDALVASGHHAILVGNIVKNGSQIVSIETMEETPPLAVRNIYYANPSSSQKSLSDLLSKLNRSSSYQYSIYRLYTTVSFNANSGSVDTTSIPVRTGEAYGIYNNNTLPTPTRTGYDFVGWFTKISGGSLVTASTIVTNEANHTLYASWEPKSLVVTFDVSKVQMIVRYGEPYGTLPTVSETGYTFDGWYTKKSGGTQVTSSTIVTQTSNHTLYAHWTAKEYLVIFSVNGGDSVSPGSKMVTYGSTYGDLPTPIKSGYYFTGWNTKADGTGTFIGSSTQVTTASKHTLYAIWSLNGVAPIILESTDIKNDYLKEIYK